jgi:hypothetical protein
MTDDNKVEATHTTPMKDAHAKPVQPATEIPKKS